jgi:hypothetical protein
MVTAEANKFKIQTKNKSGGCQKVKKVEIVEIIR